MAELSDTLRQQAASLEAQAASLRAAADALEDDTDNGRRDVADLTVSDLAEKLDKSASTVRGWMPDVPGAYRLGAEWRVSREDWRAYLDGLAQEDEEELSTLRSRPGADLSDWRQERS